MEDLTAVYLDRGFFSLDLFDSIRRPVVYLGLIFLAVGT